MFYTTQANQHHFVLYSGPHEEGNGPIVLCIKCGFEPSESVNAVRCLGTPVLSKFQKLATHLAQYYSNPDHSHLLPDNIARQAETNGANNIFLEPLTH